jgi:hypothetical protein
MNSSAAAPTVENKRELFLIKCRGESMEDGFQMETVGIGERENNTNLDMIVSHVHLLSLPWNE